MIMMMVFTIFCQGAQQLNTQASSSRGYLPWHVGIGKERFQLLFCGAQHTLHEEQNYSPSPPHPAEDKWVIGVENMTRGFSSRILAISTTEHLFIMLPHRYRCCWAPPIRNTCLYRWIGKERQKHTHPPPPAFAPKPHGLILHLLRFMKTW